MEFIVWVSELFWVFMYFMVWLFEVGVVGEGVVVLLVDVFEVNWIWI